MATSTSSGSSTQQSFSEPTYLETPENLLINQLSAVAAGLAQQMNAWAQGVYAQTSQITDQAVNNFFNVSQRMTNFAGGLTDQYNNLFAPQNAQLVAEANSYASEPRLRANMGMAGATQAIAGENALRNSERDLLSYGIDPSSGRYAALDKAAEVQNAANIAGAENMQRVADVATGQRLRSEAVQVGAQLPAAISNAQNTAIQANTGASNASLANANTGANLNRLPNEYLRTAMDIKLPLSGQRSQSQGRSQQQSQSSSPDSGGSRGGGGGGVPGGGGGGGVPYYGGGGGPAWQSMSGRGVNVGGGRGGGRMYNPSAAIRQIGPMQPNSGVYDYGGYDPGFSASDFDYLNAYNDPGYFSGTGWGSIDEQMYDPIDYVGSNPFSDYGFGQEYDYGGLYQTYGGNDYSDFGDVSGWGNQSNISYDPQANAYDPGWDNYYDTPTQWSDTPQSSWNDYGGSSYFGQDYSGGGYQDYGSYASYSDPSSNYTWASGEVYARGGEVKPSGQHRMPDGSMMNNGAHRGQMVPPHASPSMGRRTDDVRANLNAGEFVIPEDVARWKGAEFFHNLIDKSRKTRTMSPVGGKPMPAGDPRAKGPPTFSTQR